MQATFYEEIREQFQSTLFQIIGCILRCSMAMGHFNGPRIY